jgi:hypothetical protein
MWKKLFFAYSSWTRLKYHLWASPLDDILCPANKIYWQSHLWHRILYSFPYLNAFWENSQWCLRCIQEYTVLVMCAAPARRVYYQSAAINSHNFSAKVRRWKVVCVWRSWHFYYPRFPNRRRDTHRPRHAWGKVSEYVRRCLFSH